MNVIFQRVSIRSFLDKPVPDEMIQSLLKAAMQAPSASNRQPWHYVVIKDRNMLDEIPAIHPFAAMAKEASLGIVVCGDLTLSSIDGYWVQDCSAATQNILLQAVYLGLGAVWCGIYPRKERVDAFKELLQLPSHIIPLCVIPIGFPAIVPDPRERYLSERVHHNVW